MYSGFTLFRIFHTNKLIDIFSIHDFQFINWARYYLLCIKELLCSRTAEGNLLFPRATFFQIRIEGPTFSPWKFFSRGLSVIVIFWEKGSPSSWFFEKRALRHRDFLRRGLSVIVFLSRRAKNYLGGPQIWVPRATLLCISYSLGWPEIYFGLRARGCPSLF